MTVVKGESKRYLPGLTQFIGKNSLQLMTVALIAPVSVQMERILHRVCMQCVHDQTKPLFLDGSTPVIPTTNEKGKMYVEYDITTQNYRLALRLDNYIVQKTIPESAYV